MTPYDFEKPTSDHWLAVSSEILRDSSLSMSLVSFVPMDTGQDITEPGSKRLEETK